jgi:hypothetical protein
MKYIRDFDDRIVLFDARFDHKKISESLNMKPKSAGLVFCADGFLVIDGGSITLGISGLPDDITIIADQLMQ